MKEKKSEGKSKIIVNIDSIHCADCALNIERSVEHLPGVLSAEVSYIHQASSLLVILNSMRLLRKT
jgi:copper chaperone CopZ